MTRIYVTEPDPDAYPPSYYADDTNGPRRNAGYFTEESATYFHGDKGVFDGSNLADVNTRDQNRGQCLYRTAQGRWVLRTWSNWQGEVDTYSYVSEDDARDWLIFNNKEDAAQKYFGEIEDERGPGRPEVGGKALVRFGDLLPEVDAWAARAGVSRSEALRRLVATGLEAEAAASI